MEFLKPEYNKFKKLQFESVGILTQITAGSTEDTAIIIRLGAVPRFISLLKTGSTRIIDEAVWALANIAGNGPQSKNLVLNLNILDDLPLTNLTSSTTKIELSLLQSVAFLLSNLCSGEPMIKWKY